jgi:vacuolar protein sorting-associated protein 13A/C
VGEGIVKGFSSAGTSIWSGVSGVFTKPIEGAKDGGVGGFIKGVGKGGAGLVTKTVSGVVDIVAKTSEGLDNQTKSQIHMMIASRRIRNPRPLYEYNYILKEYNDLHANWYQCIQVNQKNIQI